MARNSNQRVDAFTASVELLEKALQLARKKRMTKSGFYRYALAKECGYTEDEALAFSEHRGVTNSIDKAAASASSLNEVKGDGNFVVSQSGKKNLLSGYPHSKGKKKEIKK